MESFRTRDARQEKALLDNKQATHQESKNSVLVINHYSITDVQLAAPDGTQLPVKRVRVIKRVSNTGDVLDADNASGYTDYYKPEATTKLQVVLHFTAGALGGSMG